MQQQSFQTQQTRAGVKKSAVCHCVALLSDLKKKNNQFDAMAPKLLSYLAHNKIMNRYHTISQATAILKDMQRIVLFFSSVNDTDTELLSQLIRLHATAREHHIRLEVLFVPTDLIEEDAWACFARQGDWFALTHQSDAIFLLLSLYEVTGTPRIVVIQRDGRVVSEDGAADIRQYGINAMVAWTD